MEKKKSGADFGAEVNRLKIQGPERLYLVWGDEDYLRDRFVEQLRSACLGDGEADFNYRRMSGQNMDLRDLDEAVRTPPFLGSHVFIELRDYDVNACREDQQERLLSILGDIPEGCTVAMIEDIGYVPDGRLGVVKKLKKLAHTVEFTAQEQQALVRWIGRRFADLGKDIARADAEYLIFTSGSLMSQLIPEIEKLAGYVAGSRVTRADIDKVAIKLPEARVFELSDRLAERDYDGAADVLAKLLLTRESPIKLIAIVGQQMRRLYAAKLLSAPGGRPDELYELCGVKPGYAASRLMNTVRRLDIGWIEFACEMCAEYDYRMKSTADDDEELLKELLVRLAAGK